MTLPLLDLDLPDEVPSTWALANATRQNGNIADDPPTELFLVLREDGSVAKSFDVTAAGVLLQMPAVTNSETLARVVVSRWKEREIPTEAVSEIRLRVSEATP